MARSQAKLVFGAYTRLKGLSKDAKLLYFELLIEPTVNQAGVGALRERLWSREVELTMAETEKALQELDENRYVLVDVDTEEILVRTLIRNDGVAEKPNLLWAACRAAPLVKSPRLRRALAEELRKLPPKPEATVGKNGKAYQHPDPHATADAIDPGDLPDDPAREPSPNHSGTIREPSPNQPRTTCGGGGGGGGGSVPPVEHNLSSKNKHTRASRSTRETDPEGFEEFWSACPRKEGKRDAAKAYASALKRGVEPAQMLTAIRRYAAITEHSERRFIAHPATWLNKGRYDDEPVVPSTGLAVGSFRTQPAHPTGGTTNERVNAILALKRGTN